MEYMSSRERMIAALGNKQPDRIPAAPDISNMIPCRITGKPFWDIYVNNNPPLWKAYLDAVDHLGIDGWFIYGDLQFKTRTTVDMEIISKTQELWMVKYTYHTPDGDLTQVMANQRANPPTSIDKMIKDFKKDFKKYKHIWSDEFTFNDSLFKQQKKELGDKGIMSVVLCGPGLYLYEEHFHGSLEAATYAYYDYPELFEELREIHEKQVLKQVEIAIDAGTDSIITGGSGSLTLQSPDIWREYSLPTIEKITKMCKEAGVISGVHSCGKERYLVEMCATRTDLDYVNPLEIPPMGDCCLSEIKKSFGKRFALMGNLHTADVMLNGSVNDVRYESLKAIRDAGIGGGFVLSTGDQCGRDTPDENIFAMVESVKEFGQYPLDLDRIQGEIDRLENLKKTGKLIFKMQGGYYDTKTEI